MLRSFPMIRSLKASVWLTLLAMIPAVAFSSSVLSGLWGMWLILLAGPLTLLAAGLFGGLAPMLAGLAALLAQPLISLGATAAWVMALYLAPFTLTFILVTVRRTPFFRAAGLLCAVYLFSAFACLLILQRVSGGDLYLSLARRFASLLVRGDTGDQVLVLLYQNGMIQLDPSMLRQASGLLGGLSVQGRQELTNSLVSTLADSFSQVPAMAVNYAVWACFGGFGLLICLRKRSVQKKKYGAMRQKELMEAVRRQREAVSQGDASARLELESYESFLARMTQQEKDQPQDETDFGMPPFSTWYLPRGLGLMLGLPAIGLLMGVLGTSVAERTVGGILGSLFTAVYGLQGVSVFDFIQKKSGRSLGGRFVFTLILMLLFRFLFVVMGLIDQIMNIRRLRPAEPENGE